MKPSIYDQHDKAFARTSAFVIAKNGERVATVAIRFPADGAGRLYAYVHWLGVPMVRGMAGGYGYDKRTAAVADAAAKLHVANAPEMEPGGAFEAFWLAIRKDGGHDWTRSLEDAGFRVWQAV